MLRSHGGFCCGIRHSIDWSISKKDAVRKLRGEQYDGVLSEVVVTDNQLLNRPWLPGLLVADGYRLVSRFRNVNSGNIVNVFHRHRNPLSTDQKDLPFSLEVVPTTGGWVPAATISDSEDFARVRVNKPGSFYNGVVFNYVGKGLKSKTCNVRHGFRVCRFLWEHIEVEIEAEV